MLTLSLKAVFAPERGACCAGAAEAMGRRRWGRDLAGWRNEARRAIAILADARDECITSLNWDERVLPASTRNGSLSHTITSPPISWTW